MKRAFLIVLDSFGIGALPDADKFGDLGANTLGSIRKSEYFSIPNLVSLGLGNIDGVDNIEKTDTPLASFGRCAEKSMGKDTTVGHWEIAGLISEKPFATFPNGFPDELISKFIEKTQCGGILANCPASGTAIIEKLNNEHHKTKFPIVYTSADSVFQIAVDTDLIPLDTLY